MEAVHYYVNVKTLFKLHTRNVFYSVWIHGSIYVTHVLDFMARAADEMDADVSIWRNKILVAETCYLMVNSWTIRFDGFG